jgi:hypothetical protein
MEPGSAHRLPFQRHVQRVVGELCHLIIIALIKADAFAAFNVNGRYDFDGVLLGELSAVSYRLSFQLSLNLSLTWREK